MEEEDIYRFFDRITAFEKREKDADDRKTYDEVFDKRTLTALSKLISNGVIATLDFPISTGKEGNVFRATDENGILYAVKIYRTSTSTYKNLMKYVIGDPRFKSVPKDRRGAIYLWAQKEYKNLARMFNASVSVPEPKKLLANVLVMSYIGCGEQPAPMMRDVILEKPKKSFDAVVDMMERLHSKAGLVHGDLSEYNILVESGECFLIDVGQSVVLDHPLARELLRRDVTNICKYFGKLGVKSQTEAIYRHITGEGK